MAYSFQKFEYSLYNGRESKQRMQTIEIDFLKGRDCNQRIETTEINFYKDRGSKYAYKQKKFVL